MVRGYMAVLAAIVIAGCDEITAAVDPIAPDNARFVSPLPEEIAGITAPGQDLTAVWILEEDNCFWYRHAGPVETTLLPLRNVNGRPICAKAEA